MNNPKLNLILIFSILLFANYAYSQDTISSKVNSTMYVLSANVSFERSGIENYVPHEDFQLVNNFGLSVAKKISTRLWIEVNPQIIKNETILGIEENSTYNEYLFVSDNLRVPINLQYYINSFYFKIGPYCDFPLDIHSNYFVDFEDYYEIDSFGYGIGSAAGMKNRLYKKIYLFSEFRYNQNINFDLQSYVNSNDGGRFVNYGFNIGLNIHL